MTSWSERFYHPYIDIGKSVSADISALLTVIRWLCPADVKVTLFL